MNSLKKTPNHREWTIYISFRKFLGDFQNKIVNMDYHVFVSVSSVSRKKKTELRKTLITYT